MNYSGLIYEDRSNLVCNVKLHIMYLMFSPMASTRKQSNLLPNTPKEVGASAFAFHFLYSIYSM